MASDRTGAGHEADLNVKTVGVYQRVACVACYNAWHGQKKTVQNGYHSNERTLPLYLLNLLATARTDWWFNPEKLIFQILLYFTTAGGWKSLCVRRLQLLGFVLGCEETKTSWHFLDEYAPAITVYFLFLWSTFNTREENI